MACELDVWQLRPMVESDLPDVLDIESATQLTPWSERNFADCLKSDYRCSMILEGDRAAGFVILSSILDELHVLNIAVAPNHQRRGIARWVLTRAIEQARAEQMSVIYLEVRESNRPAIALYQQLGFEITGRRKAYYRRGEGREDALLMTLALDDGHK